MLFQKLAGASLLIFVNKQDLPNALTCEEIIEFLELNHHSSNQDSNNELGDLIGIHFFS